MPLSPGTPLGAFEIVAGVGACGMDELYCARDTTLPRDVAIKVLPDSVAADADRLARFTREAQTLAAFNHSNIAHVYGLERTERTESPTAFIVMDDRRSTVGRGTTVAIRDRHPRVKPAIPRCRAWKALDPRPAFPAGLRP
jgi:hypothetical protein